MKKQNLTSVILRYTQSSAHTAEEYGNPRYFKDCKVAFLKDFDDAKTLQDDADILEAIQMFSSLYMKGACRTLSPEKTDAVANGLQLTWAMVLQVAQDAKPASPMHDKLITLLHLIKETNSLHRRLNSHLVAVPDSTWETYGFFDRLQRFWVELIRVGDAEQLICFITFVAKLLTIGTWNTVLAPVIHWYMQQALEHGNPSQMIALLPGTAQLFHIASKSLFSFCFNDELYGFTPDRWLFWREQFQKLGQDPAESVGEDAMKGRKSMIGVEMEFGYDVIVEI